MKLDATPIQTLVQVERTAFGVSWTIRAETFEQVKTLWDKCEAEYATKKGIRKGSFRQGDEE